MVVEPSVVAAASYVIKLAAQLLSVVVSLRADQPIMRTQIKSKCLAHYE